MATHPALDELDALISDLQQLAALDPLDRARWVRDMDTRVRAVVGRVGDEAVWEARARDRLTQAEIGQALGVTRYRVNNALVAYKRWLAEASGRPAA